MSVYRSYSILKVNKIPLQNIPTYLLGSKNPVGFEMNYFGNDLLKRFNTIVDLKKDQVYLKPNKLINLPYQGIHKIKEII